MLARSGIAHLLRRTLPVCTSASEQTWQLAASPLDRDGSCSASTSGRDPWQPAACSQLTFTRGMAFKKAGGQASQKKSPRPKHRGIKFGHGEIVFPGQIIMRQKGLRWHPGYNVGLAKDQTIFATSVGLVHFTAREIKYPNDRVKTEKVISVVPVNGDWSSAYKEAEQDMIARRAVLKRQMFKARAHEAALFFPLPQKQQRTYPVVLPPPQPAAAPQAASSNSKTDKSASGKAKAPKASAGKAAANTGSQTSTAGTAAPAAG